MLRSRRIFCQRNMWPNLLHESTTSCRTDHSAETTDGTPEPLSLASNPSLSSVTLASRAPSLNPLAPGKSRRAGMENNAHQAPEPPMANRSASVDPPACWTGSRVTSRSKMPAVYPRAMPSEEMRAVARESFSESPRSEEGREDAARRGRYAFSTTMDAPKPMFAKTARRPEKGQMGDEDGRRKKQREEKEPSAANPNSNGLRYEAGFRALSEGRHRIWAQ